MIHINQITDSDASALNFDFFIAASGFESRAVCQAQKYAKNSLNKISLGFIGHPKDPIRQKNDSVFKNLGFDMLIIDESEDNNTELNNIIRHILEYSYSKDKISVYIDYSCMTRHWYSYLLYRLFNLPTNSKIKLYFGYSHAKYIKHKKSQQSLNRVVKPLLGYCGIDIPSKSTALIIGMGNEPNRICGLRDYFDASPYLFYTDESYNEKYSQEICRLNNDIISITKEENIYRFPVYDLMYTNYLLDSLCRSLLKEHRVIIAPCGPKPFALLSMIISLKYDNLVEVWRISPGINLQKKDRKPTGLVSIIEVSFLE